MSTIATRRSRLSLLIVAGLLAVSTSPAAAATTYVKFYTGGSGYTGPYNGGTTVYGHTSGSATNCPTGSPGCTSADVLGTPNLVFTGFGNTITASPDATITGNKVWDDTQPAFGGLGVGTGTPSNEDQIAGTDVLTLAFSSPVTLTGVATLFVEPHADFGPGFEHASDVLAASSAIQFLLSVDGGSFALISFLTANNELLSITGTSFAFEQARSNPSFYVSALAFDPSPVPIPAALPLFASGLGGLGLLHWRRKRKKVAALAAA